MKKIIYTALFSIILLHASAQTGYVLNSLSLPPNTVVTSCDTVVSVSFSAQTASNNTGTVPSDLPYIINGTNFVPSQFTFQVSWGDGSVNQANGGVSTTGTNISLNPPFNHTFGAPGTYNIVTTVYNMANQTYAIDTVSYTVGSCNMNVSSVIQVDCDNNGTIDSTLNGQSIPVIITGSGQVYTGTMVNNMVLFTGIQPGYYSITIDPTWLQNHNYVINTIQGPQSLIPGSTSTIIFILNCNNGGGTPSAMCLGGQVYCDQDGNGVFSSGDILLSNAAVTVNYGSGSMTVYTNNQGNYTATYMGISGNTTIVSLNSNWMSSHGYTSNFLLDTILNVPCQAGIPPAVVTFGINCGQNQGNTICYSGFVFCDANGNGTMNAGELPIMFAPVTLYVQNPGSNMNSVIVYTDSTGFFTYCGPISNTNYALALINQQWLTYNGYTSTGQVVTLVGSNTGTTNIGMIAVNCGAPVNPCTDLWTTVSPWIGYYQNSLAYVKLQWGNYGPSATGSYTLTFTYPAGVTVNTSSISNTAYTISGNTITWNITSSQTSFSGIDIITFNVPSGLSSGTPHYFTSTITATGNITDCNSQNNNGSLLQLVGNSYDPNDKNVNRSIAYNNETWASDLIDVALADELTYTIRFQNTGTAPAQNVYVIDTLDAELDWSTFYAIESSHPMTVVDLGNGVRRFEFNQIWLPDSATNEPQSHGQFTYRIKENNNNAMGSTITNTAHIFFDWNPAIVTNTTININTSMWNVNEYTWNSKIYPNPSTGLFNVEVEGVFEVELLDIQGRLVESTAGTDKITFDSSTLQSGCYLLKINKDGQHRTERIIVK